MRGLTRGAGTALLLAFLSGAALAAEPAPIPDGYRMTDYRSPTPAGLPGAVTVDTARARALVEAGEVLPVNVLKLDRSTLPGGPWIVAKPFPQIPGGVWLPNVGLGALTPELEGYFRGRLEALTKGDRGRGLMFYCLADCWMSWNAAKRALAMGYRRVYWFRDGMDGWAEAGLPTEEAKPLPVADR
ncbi:PQQ-dependent catabolism-associated CXXCW motif protein [Azospirillum rugosum]|uniref:PQQ-dependent catabolism-associated CXXCW motif protein n=1 Tax=Azospirillum rugosum TaxID=416170 RepID=A0ABS4SKB7_9PROT|nr:PQQ-dependent catabolism-associated CXXCW motif protein [Azospirillum rugosum]MBP2293009.1 PQQ-dependent catabolism-associated CXXCW motif protein [Azospirillum rugosum]MDQ0526558.1 PQQ-dependent catabolism-associated CXXCW motif protein [Azospirillum rugosum]